MKVTSTRYPDLVRWLAPRMLFLLLAVSLRAVDAPLVIPFQGLVTSQAGAAVPSGQYSLIFNLYDVAVGGQPLWTERHSKVGVINGAVNVFLGSITPLDAVDFSQTRYLGITVDTDDKPTTPDPEMVPRQMIIPAFWAKRADNATKLAGKDWSAVMVDAGGAPTNDPTTGVIPTARLKDSAVTLAKLSANSVDSVRIVDGTIEVADLSAAAKQSIVPAGTILPFGGASAPAGYMFCAGQALSRTAYPALFAAIGTAWGAPNSSEFFIPDLRGRFVRGADDPDGSGPIPAAGNDPEVGGRYAYANGGNAGNQVGSLQNGATAKNGLNLYDPGHTHGVGGGAGGGVTIIPSPGSAFAGISGSATGYVEKGDDGRFLIQGRATGITLQSTDTETRPSNVAVNYIIKL